MLSIELRESGQLEAAIAANGELDCCGVRGDISDIGRNDKGLAMTICLTKSGRTLLPLLMVLSDLTGAAAAAAAAAAAPQSGQRAHQQTSQFRLRCCLGERRVQLVL